MRGEDDAAGVAGPVLGIEGGVVFGEVGIAGVAEDALDEIEVGDEGARDEEPRFHRALGREAGHGGDDDGAEMKRDERLGRDGFRGGERQAEKIGGRVERVPEQVREDGGRDAFFVVGNREAALGDVEDALRGAAVALGIVEDALAHAVGSEDGAVVLVAARRERERAGEAGAVEDERGVGQARDLDGAVAERIEEEILDALVDGAEVAGEGAVLLAAEGEEVADEVTDAAVVGQRDAGLADLAELEVEVGEDVGMARIGGGRKGGGRSGGGVHAWDGAFAVPIARARATRVMRGSLTNDAEGGRRIGRGRGQRRGRKGGSETRPTSDGAPSSGGPAGGRGDGRARAAGVGALDGAESREVGASTLGWDRRN